MAKIGYVDKVMTVKYDTQGTQTGLTDLLAVVYNPAGTEIVGSPFTMAEIGTTGVYQSTYTPDTVGEYTAIVSSALSSPVITNKAGTMQILEDIMGATYSAATDSLEAIRDLGDTMDGKLDTIDGVVDAINLNTDTLETSMTSIDGKIDTIDGIVDTINTNTDTLEASMTTLDGKVDTIDTVVDTINTNTDTVEASLTTIEGKIDIIDTNVDDIEAATGATAQGSVI